VEELTTLQKIRYEKLQQIIQMGINPYPYSYHRTHLAEEIVKNFEHYENQAASLAGRVMSIRKHGRAAFAHIMDSSGRIQIYVRQDQVGETQFQLFDLIDIGDIIGVTGDVFKTRTGEITILVKQFELLSKTLRPLPIVKEKIEEG